MKISTFNNIERYFWFVWKAMLIILAILFIWQGYMAWQLGNPRWKVVNTESVKEVEKIVTKEKDSDLEASIKVFKKKHVLTEIYMFDWDTDVERWNLEYKDTYEGQTVHITKKFKSISEMVDFLNSK